MKLRIKGDSLRLRISPGEMSLLLQHGRIEETVHFGPEHDAKLTYALLASADHPAQGEAMKLLYRPQAISVVVAAIQVRTWANGTEVGMYAEVNTGEGQLELAVEKDFACLDKGTADNQDTFPNPSQRTTC
jgi:hypothetical protein